MQKETGHKDEPAEVGSHPIAHELSGAGLPGTAQGASPDPASPEHSGAATQDRPTDDEVRERAFRLWENAGRPEGQGEAHWRQAREELEIEARAQHVKPKQPM